MTAPASYLAQHSTVSGGWHSAQEDDRGHATQELNQLNIHLTNQQNQQSTKHSTDQPMATNLAFMPQEYKDTATASGARFKLPARQPANKTKPFQNNQPIKHPNQAVNYLSFKQL